MTPNNPTGYENTDIGTTTGKIIMTETDKEYIHDVEASIKLFAKTQRASTSAIQRHLRIGYMRACRIMDILEQRGLVGACDGSNPRTVNIPKEATDEGC